MIFTPAELAVLRASDRIVDQEEPGGAIYHRDRDPRLVNHEGLDQVRAIIRERSAWPPKRRMA